MTDSRLVAVSGMREGGVTKGHKETFHVFTTLIEVAAPCRAYVKTSQIAHSKYVQLIMCQV